jgi:uncharacterized protein (TIGR03437 family)
MKDCATLLFLTAAFSGGQADAQTYAIHAPGYTAANIAPTVGGGITVDTGGNLYAAYGAYVYKITPAGRVSTVAGGGLSLGDGGPATSASLGAAGVAVDSAGNLYISDNGNNRIRKISTNGTISTIAGPGGTSLGDGGPATSASLSAPAGIAIDSSGNIFFADEGNNRIRKISPAGIITTVAGGGPASKTGGSIGDGGPATSATLSRPTAVAVDSSGNLYIADSYNYRIRKVSTSGVITTLAGNDRSGSYGDGGPAALAELDDFVQGVAVDGSGNSFFTETFTGRLRAISPAGRIDSIAGGGTVHSTTYTGPASNLELDLPSGIAVSPGGVVYVADGATGIWQLTPSSIPALPPPVIFSSNSASGFLASADELLIPGGTVLQTITPGGWMEIYGSYLGYDTRSWGASDFSGTNAPTSLDGTSVTIGGQPAFVSYISPSQVNVQVSSTTPTGLYPLVVTTANGSAGSVPTTIPVTPTSTILLVRPVQPELLSPPLFNIDGTPYAVALFPDGVTYVLPTGAIPGVPSRPAKSGETITLYGIGFGATTPDTPAGQIVPSANTLALPLKVTIAGAPATVPYAGLAPGIVGLYQFNVVIPVYYSSPTTVPVSLFLGGSSSTTLYLSVE